MIMQIPENIEQLLKIDKKASKKFLEFYAETIALDGILCYNVKDS